jgi:hypothetical protein
VFCVLHRDSCSRITVPLQFGEIVGKQCPPALLQISLLSELLHMTS